METHLGYPVPAQSQGDGGWAVCPGAGLARDPGYFTPPCPWCWLPSRHPEHNHCACCSCSSGSVPQAGPALQCQAPLPTTAASLVLLLSVVGTALLGHLFLFFSQFQETNF